MGSRGKTKEAILTDSIKEVRVCPIEEMGSEKKHSSEKSTQRSVTIHSWVSVGRSRVAAGPCVLGWGKGWEEQGVAGRGAGMGSN